MGNTDAEAQCPHLTDVGDLVPDLGEHDASSRVVAGVDVCQLPLVVPPATPGDLPEVGPVSDSEVVEGAEKISAERVPQSELGSGASIEERAHVSPISALWGGRESE